MQQFESEICHYTEDIWKSILQLDVKPTEDKFSPLGGESILAGCVHITGEWDGAVALDCPVELAKKVASIMFQLKEEEITTDLVEDGLGELTNMTGGNIKSLLPEPCYLSLPAVTMTQHGLKIPGSELITSITFQCWGYNFRVSVLKKIEKSE
ncbi:MAG: chemotaxis protein CheX [Nitrospinae bacterium]|nr:chemotaxis protein CheX [Nitrospinota bacterium]MZH06096.1 chemotaxis protein CheX [Nitrospinota bacterium]MZH15417.1 chemotaxis protein CheX [Nitrospinota bacterium]